MNKPRWSVRTVNTQKGKYAIVSGLAYPSLIKGANPTNRISSSLKNRNEFYHDPALRLTTDDIDALDGAEGAPLCVEHNRRDVVGSVHHTFVDHDDPRQGWKIIARVPLNERGEQVVADIKAGKLNGFSVGYEGSLEHGRNVKFKTFHEISLVQEPFFDGCNLSVSVRASKKDGGKFLTK